ncbi:Serine carboxypeptidase-like 48 [Striga hermonthica]|uniref:Carboxypeptidase n=1 Tax=Striga hermonthica TaxID=68872 RepID=A0A9N7NLB3_STRHE|nr:Serine carboxypeptidase-like 48 [Striga hermonthica]
MMTSPLVVALLFLYAFLISSTLSFSDLNNGEISSYPKRQAEKLIRSLNLFPEHEVNRHRPESNDASVSGIVEKRFKFPFMEANNPIQDLGHHAGYYSLPHSKAARMFYFFFESRSNKSDPVVIWLTGGPGCSSGLALFYENGPFHVTDNLTLVSNEFGWDKVSNIIYVDQPTGTGFSYSSDLDDTRHDEKGVSTDLYDFLQAFFKAHPQLAGNDFYITGESYAGHYIPALAARVHQGNKNNEGIQINLKGFAIGNGLTNPEIQYGAYADYALNMSLITKSDYDSMTQSVFECQEEIKLCGVDGGSYCRWAFSVCNDVFNNIVDIAKGVNYYDIRKQCGTNDLCYDFSNMEKFLNSMPVKRSLGVGNISFVSCSTDVYDAMTDDQMRNMEVGIPALLEDGIKFLAYAGEYDLICNWLGNWRWVHAMEWSGQDNFVATNASTFRVGGVDVGLQKGYGPLTFLKFYNAGHMVPMDQPEFSLEMLRRWMQGNLSSTDV